MTDDKKNAMPLDEKGKKIKAVTKRRIASIDLFRGFLLTNMVVIHFIMNLGKHEVYENPLFLFFEPGLGIWGAAGFLMVMGMRVAFSNDCNQKL